MFNKKIKSIGLLISILFVSIAIFGCGGQKAAEQPKTEEAKTEVPQEKITLKMVGTLPLQHHITKAAEVFKDAVEKNSNGKIIIEFYPAQQLYNDKDIVNVLPKGGVELGLIQPDFWSGLVPSTSLFQFLTYFDDYDHYWAALEGEPGQIINKDFEQKANCKVLTWVDYGDIEVISKKPIKKAEDINGMRLRAYGEGCAIWLGGVKAAPVSMSSTEVYQALQRGTIDGALSGATSFYERKWYEVCKYMTKAPIAHTAHTLLINLDAWNKLSPDLQKVLMDAAKEAREFNKKAWVEEDSKARDELMKQGMTANTIPAEELTKWRETGVSALIDNFKTRVGAEEAQKILDATEALRKK